MAPGNLIDWVALHLLPGLGPILARRALERCDDPAEIAFRLPVQALEHLGGLGPKGRSAIAAARPTLARRAERELQRSEKMGLTLLTPLHPDYPAAFENLPDAPLLLYVKGELRQGLVRIAVVGSRRATLYGKRVATGLASGLAARGVEVVSGGARGIDTCAHLGALEEQGRTVAVLGSGFAQLYPVENAALFERIAASGALVSEFALDEPPRPENFPRRNRLISGLSAALVVVEASTRSGSLSTARHALEQGREVMAVPGPVASEQSQGCHKLIQDGAKLVQNVDDVLEELSPMYRQALPAMHAPAGTGREGSEPGPTSPDEAAVLGLLDSMEALQLDALAGQVPFGVARLQAALFGLELRGAIEQHPGRYYTRAARPAEPG